MTKILISSCLLGYKVRYDGTCNRRLRIGMGITAALLTQHGVQVFDETQINQALDAAAQFLPQNILNRKNLTKTAS